MKTKIITLFLFIAFSIVFVAWRYNESKKAGPPAKILVIMDRSTSTLDNCESLSGLVHSSYSFPGVRKGSTITVLASGDRQTANEPVFIAQYEVPTSGQVIEGGHKAREKKLALLTDLQAKCKAQKATQNTPIYLSLKRGLEQLRSLGCTKDGLCHLLVFTDGDETSDPWLKQALRSKKSLASDPPIKINAQGIKIVFCGLSSTQDKRKKRTIRQTEIIKQAWQAIFENNKPVFQPFCPTLILTEGFTDSSLSLKE